MAETEEQRTNLQRAYELKAAVEKWIDREFNFVTLATYEKCNEYLFESIRQQPVENFVYDYFNCLSDETIAELKEQYVEDVQVENPSDENLQEYLAEHKEDEIREWADNGGYNDNYPMWSTLFEFRSEPPSDWLDKAQEVGLGVIDPQAEFNSTLFATSCGHSFYGSYWIPLYLSIHGGETRKKWAGVDFSMM